MRQAHSRKPASNIDQEVGTACSLKQQLATPIGVQSAYMFADYQSPKLEATTLSLWDIGRLRRPNSAKGRCRRR